MKTRAHWGVVAFVVLFPMAAARAASVSDACQQIPELLNKIHRADWTSLGPEGIERIVPFKLSRLEAKYPSNSAYDAPCSGSLYLIAENRGEWRLSIEFDHSNTDQGCQTLLNSVAFEARTENSIAEETRGRTAVLVQAGGKPSGAGDGLQYQWRSTDSRTRFDLFSSVVTKAKRPRPATDAVVKVILRHDTVIPSDVDDLPFEKGFFCEKP